MSEITFLLYKLILLKTWSQKQKADWCIGCEFLLPYTEGYSLGNEDTVLSASISYIDYSQQQCCQSHHGDGKAHC